MRILATLVILLCVGFLKAQDKAFQKGSSFFEKEEYALAIEQFNKSKLSNKADLYYYKAQCYHQLNLLDSSARYFELLSPMLKTEVAPFYEYAQVAQGLGEYDKARKLVKRFLLKAPNSQKGKLLLQSCEQSDSLLVNRKQLFLDELPLNTDHDDFAAHFTEGFQNIYFCSNRPQQNGSKSYSRNATLFINLYQAKKGIASGFSEAKALQSLNSKLHEGPVAFDSTNQTMYFTRSVKTPHSEHNYSYTLGIFFSTWTGTNWSKPKAFEYNVKGYSVGHPALSRDGQQLYFTSDQPGSIGATDLYICERTAEGWSKPKNLGAPVNTLGKEMFPSVLINGDLSFASDGHPGLGALDLFVLHDGKVLNPGAPLNSNADDFALVYSNKAGTEGYVSSNRDAMFAGDNIFSFKPISIQLHGYVYDKISGKPVKGANLRLVNKIGDIQDISIDKDGFYKTDLNPEEHYELQFTAPNYELERGVMSTIQVKSDVDTAMDIFLNRGKTPVVEGVVLDKEKTEPLVGAGVELQNISEGKKEALKTDTTGYYVFFVDSTKTYELNVDHPDYFIESIPVVALKTLEKRPLKRMAQIPKVTLNRIIINKPLEIENIYYDYDKFDITPTASSILDTLANLMTDNAEIIVELSSHTDVRGTDDYNIELSRKRAQAAIAYLTQKGVEEYRIVFKFYGKTELAHPCPEQGECPESVHQLNRRTEFRVVDY